MNVTEQNYIVSTTRITEASKTGKVASEISTVRATGPRDAAHMWVSGHEKLSKEKLVTVHIECEIGRAYVAEVRMREVRTWKTTRVKREAR